MVHRIPDSDRAATRIPGGNRAPLRAGRNQIISVMVLLVGLWLFAASWILGYPFTEAAVDAHLNEIGVGIVVVLCAVARMFRPRGRLSDLVILVMGAWLVAAPFVFGYGVTAQADAARVNAVAMGSVLVLLALASSLMLSLARARDSTEDQT